MYLRHPSDAENILPNFKQITQLRNTLSPTTKLSCDEMGVILPNDNDQNVKAPPRLYWNAAGESLNGCESVFF